MKTKITALFIALSTFLSVSLIAGSEWSDNYEKALAQAKAEHKKVLLDFTGSDWCGWCIKLDKEVFSKPAFKEYADKNLVLVTVDFPQGKKLSKETQEQNDKLQAKYKIQGYPTIIILDENGKKVSEGGYVKGGPEAFIAQIEKK